METCVASVNYLVVVTSFDWRQKLYADVKFLPFFSYLPAFTVHACKANVASTVARGCAKNCFRAAQRDAPNVRVLSRIWRVVAGLSLQTCATFPAFVVVSALVDHICRVFYCITYINNAGRSTLGILCITVIVCIPNL